MRGLLAIFFPLIVSTDCQDSGAREESFLKNSTSSEITISEIMRHCAGLSIRLYHPNAAPTGLSGPGRQMRVYTASLLWDFSLVVRT